MGLAGAGSTLPSERPGAQPCVAGTVIVFHRGVLEAQLGADTFAHVLGQLDPDERREIADALPVSWVLHSTFDGLYRAVALVTGRDAIEVYTENVRHGVEHRVRRLWRILLRLSDVQALAARSKMIYEKSYSAGRMIVETVGGGRALIRVTEWPGIPELAMVGVSIGTETLLGLAGVKKAVVVAEKQPDGAVFRVTWDE